MVGVGGGCWVLLFLEKKPLCPVRLEALFRTARSRPVEYEWEEAEEDDLLRGSPPSPPVSLAAAAAATPSLAAPALAALPAASPLLTFSFPPSLAGLLDWGGCNPRGDGHCGWDDASAAPAAVVLPFG